MEQLYYFLQNTSNVYDKALGVFNFLLVFFIIPVILVLVIIIWFIKTGLYNKKHDKTNKDEKNIR